MPCEELADQFGLDDDVSGVFSIDELLGSEDGDSLSIDDLVDELD